MGTLRALGDPLEFLGLSPLALSGETVLAGVGFVCWLWLAGRLKRRVPKLAGLLGLTTWLFLLGLIVFIDASLPSTGAGGDPSALAAGLDLAFALASWLVGKSLIDLLYVDLWLGRIHKRHIDRLLVDVFKFLLLLLVLGIYLKTTHKVNLSAILTSSAILTAVIGFSMRDVIGGVVAGLLLKFERPYEVGEWVRIGEHEGQVTEITLRYTKLTPVDQSTVLIPNQIIQNERLVNMSRPSRTTFQRIVFPAPLDAPPVTVKSAALGVLKRCEYVAEIPEPMVRIKDVREDRILYELYHHPKDPREVAAARDALLAGLWYQFKNRDIDFPYYQTFVSVERPKPVRTCPPDDLAVLAASDLFVGEPTSFLELVWQTGLIRRRPAGEKIVAENDGGKTMFVVLSGLCQVRKGGRDLAELGPGAVFGEMALLADRRRSADVIAKTELRCLELDREAFRTLLERAPGLNANVKKLFAARERELLESTGRGDFAPESLFARFLRIFS